MEKLDPRLAAFIILLYVRYLPGMILEKIRVRLRNHEVNEDSKAV